MSAARRPTLRTGIEVALILLLGTAVALPAIGVTRQGRLPQAYVRHLSQAVQYHYYLQHPEQAPDSVQRGFAGAGEAPSGPAAARFGPTSDRFNRDADGLPQNEESVTVCPKRPKIVLSATNDYRGLVDPGFNFTGWNLSTDGGQTVRNEGLLPSADVAGTAQPSGGDPVVASDAGCHLYAASLAYNPDDPAGEGPNPQPSGVVVYRSNATTLSAVSCQNGPNLSDPDCWPVSQTVASQPTGPTGHFLDKEWMAVGDTGDGVHVWVTYNDFTNDFSNPAFGFSTAQVYAVRCNADLSGCTAPILISPNDQDVAFSYVTVGPDRRTYVTWERVEGELQGQPQTFTIKMRVAPAGSTAFGPEHTVATLNKAIGSDTYLHADDFRVTTGPKNDVKVVNGHPRAFVVYDVCGVRPLGTICEVPRIVLAWSDNLGVSWKQKTISAGGDNYFPTLSVDHVRGGMAVAWYTSRFDSFRHRQDVELVSLNPGSLRILKRQRVTGISNEPDADPMLGGSFIGDYFQVVARAGLAYVAYNANFRQIRLLGSGVPVGQQDNYLSVRHM